MGSLSWYVSGRSCRLFHSWSVCTVPNFSPTLDCGQRLCYSHSSLSVSCSQHTLAAYHVRALHSVLAMHTFYLQTSTNVVVVLAIIDACTLQSQGGCPGLASAIRICSTLQLLFALCPSYSMMLSMPLRKTSWLSASRFSGS